MNFLVIIVDYFFNILLYPLVQVPNLLSSMQKSQYFLNRQVGCNDWVVCQMATLFKWCIYLSSAILFCVCTCFFLMWLFIPNLVNLYPTKDPYAGLLNSSAYLTKYPYHGLCALQCCCVSFSETHCTICATFLYIPVWWDVLWIRSIPALFSTS
jgi:hypothetical protein